MQVFALGFFPIFNVSCLSFNDFIIIKVLCLSWLLESDDPKYQLRRFKLVSSAAFYSLSWHLRTI
jgi:hypothetical protein